MPCLRSARVCVFFWGGGLGTGVLRYYWRRTYVYVYWRRTYVSRHITSTYHISRTFKLLKPSSCMHFVSFAYLKSEVQPIHTMNMHRRLCHQRVVTYILSIEAFTTRIKYLDWKSSLIVPFSSWLLDFMGFQRTKCSHTSLVSEKLVNIIYSEFVLIPWSAPKMSIDRMIPFWSQLQTLFRWHLHDYPLCHASHYPIRNHRSAAFPQRTNAVPSVLPKQPIGC